MADEYNRDSAKNDNAAKTLAIIGIVLALIALGSAMKADKKAGDAANKAETSQSQSPSPNRNTSIENGPTGRPTDTVGTPGTPQ